MSTQPAVAISPRPPLGYRPSRAIPLAALVAAVIASLLNAVIALVGTASGLDDPLMDGLLPMSYLPLTIIASVGGAVGWHLINRFAARPGRILRILVPVFLLVSFVPDILVGTALGSWQYAVTLMLMHIGTITLAVLAYRRFLPIKGSTPKAVAVARGV
jgi:hypothetical protein